MSSSQQQQTQTSSPSNVSASRINQSHILTLPHIDEDDEDENGLVPLPQRIPTHLVRNKVQNDNLINLKTGCNTSYSADKKSSDDTSLPLVGSINPSPKIKNSRGKFSQQQPPCLQSLSTSSASNETATAQQQQIISSNSGETVTVSPNKMQAESGSIAELQKYHNKYLKNRRHTLANTAAINLR